MGKDNEILLNKTGNCIQMIDNLKLEKNKTLVDRIDKIKGPDKELVKKSFKELPFNMINSLFPLEIRQEGKRHFSVYPIKGNIHSVNFKGVDVLYFYGNYNISFTDHYHNNYILYFLPREK